MFRERIPASQLSAWLFAAMTPVLIQYLAGESWVWVTVLGVTGLTLCVPLWRWGWSDRHWQSVLALIYTILAIGSLLHRCHESWPRGDSYPAVPLMVLALSTWAAQKGIAAAARVGAVLFWAVLLMYLVVFGAGVRNVQLRWLQPQWSFPDALGLLVFLIPAAAACLLKPEGAWSARLAMPVVFVIAASCITVGVMSVPVARGAEDAFYEMSRSISLGGVAKRFEAVISAGMTVGWFAVTTLLLSVCGALTQKICTGWGRAGVWLGAVGAAGWLLCGLHIPGWMMLAGGVLFWVVIPVLTQGLGLRKKSKKSENNA